MKESTDTPRARVGACARGLGDTIQDEDGYINTRLSRPRARTRELPAPLCTLEEAAAAADYAIEQFGTQKDRGLWMWYCRRIGLNRFLDIADEVSSLKQQGEINYPIRLFQLRLKEAFPKQNPSARDNSAKGGAK